jgi:hypothetical protein
MRTTRLLSAVLLLGLPVTQAGCLIAAAAVGTGATVAYVRGDLETTLDAAPAQVATASLAAANALDLVIISHDTDGLGGKIVIRTADDTKIVITIQGQSDNLSKVTIRAGTFGNNTLQQRVFEKIKANLAEPTTRAMTTTAP